MDDHPLSLRPLQLGLSLGTFLLIAFVACLALAMIVPDRGLHQPWLQFLPGFTWTLPGMLLGAVESFAYGAIVGIVFAPIANFFGIVRRG